MKLIYMTIVISVSLCIMMSPCTAVFFRIANDNCNSADQFHYQSSTHQCFKLFPSVPQIAWAAATKLCKDNNLEMAHPLGPIGLERLLNFFSGPKGVVIKAWLNAKFVGSVYKWQDDNTSLLDNSPYWQTAPPTVKNGGCLVMSGLAGHPDEPYTSLSCSTGINQVICEKVLSGPCHDCITSGISHPGPSGILIPGPSGIFTPGPSGILRPITSGISRPINKKRNIRRNRQ